MNLKLITYLFFAVWTLSSCNKSDVPTPFLAPESIKTLQISGINHIISATPGNGCVLIAYKDITLKSRFVLIDNDGNILWNKSLIENLEVGYLFSDLNDEFSIFSGTRLIRIDRSGDIVFDEPDFLPLNVSYFDIKLTSSGDYLFMGSVYVGGGYRASHAKITRDGDQIYNRYYLINVNGSQAYTSAIETETGDYLLAGTFVSPIESLNDQIFLTLLSEDGEEIWTRTHEINGFDYVDIPDFILRYPGRALLQNGSTSYMYFVSSKGGQTAEKRSRIFEFDTEGELIGEPEFLDLGTNNIIPGAGLPYNSIDKNQNGGYTGIVNDYELLQSGGGINTELTYSGPQYSYFYDLGPDGSILNMEYIDQNYSSSFNSVLRLSNGKTMLIGTIMSLGLETQIMSIIR